MPTSTIPRSIQANSIPPKSYKSPYKAQKTWPPDFSKLDAKHQFRLERRYRRRTQLKWLHPTWMKWTKLAQWSICSAVVAYGLFIMDWGDAGPPIPGVREWIREQSRSIWTTSTTQLPQPTFERNRTRQDDNNNTNTT